MSKDKIIVEEGFFVQVVVSLIMTSVYFQEFLQATWRLPVMVILVIFANMYFNAVSIGYKLKSKTLKLQWCFRSSFGINGLSFSKDTEGHHILSDIQK